MIYLSTKPSKDNYFLLAEMKILRNCGSQQFQRKDCGRRGVLEPQELLRRATKRTEVALAE